MPDIETSLVRGAAVLFVLCAITALFLPGDRTLRQQMERLVLPLAVMACALALALRWWSSRQGPFMTLYEIVLSNVFSLAAVYLVAVRANALARAGAGFVMSVLALLSLWMTLLPSNVTPLPPSFANPWLWAHVLCGKVFLGCLLLTCGLGFRLLWLPAGLLSSSQARAQDTLLWRLLAIAFLFDSLMLLTGALWAQDAWGHFWTWDPLETSAFLTWLLLALVLHARSAMRMPPRWQWGSVCAIFVLAFLTFFGLPFLSMAPHKGIL